MEYLNRRAGKPYRELIFLENVWGHAFHGGSNVVDAVIQGSAKKLETGPPCSKPCKRRYRFRSECL